MAKNTVQPFRFHPLRLSEFFEMSHILFEHALPIALAQALGITVAYNKAKIYFDKLVEIFRRNPAMLQTEKLVGTIAKIRRKMVVLKTMIKELLGDSEGERLSNAKIINNVAHPYLKNATHDTQSALAANAMEMADALRIAANLPLLTQLGLKNIVEEIAELSNEAGEILYARGEEKVSRRELGNASDVRDKLEKQLRYLLYTSIPAHYTEATGALVTTFEHAISDINGALESFQHLTSGGSNSGSNPNEDEDGEPGGNEPGGSEPDTQPANPPSGGGGFTDPDA
ncbi:MAG: DUF6261 family protein [Mediterranea sp.]|jgi:hypothetical protein|nr:DUF6261 family protein [Mediterranea sp.]